ncbi:prepilin-type N-terminal cleavage/methylation domain-containing protein [Actinoplanes sp. NPDC049265]|uniref:prepilin-type N-terminal cleavage/methylation domain-containing protein n=1 Tax=Actinoplanes sp. NPDC049265 TaxID=3363902 RepID=UPI0037192A1C
MTRRDRRDDAGFSMVEIMVSLSVMSVVLVVFTSAILQAYKTSAKAESISIIQAQLQNAFQRVDRELRYASWISPPGQFGTAWYVEYAGYDGSTCGQLRLETAPASTANDSTDEAHGVMQWLTWPKASPPAAGTPGQTIASNLVTPDSAGPFERQAAGVATGSSGTDFTPDFQRLRIRVSAQRGDSTASVDTTFTALNTSRDTPPTNDCSKGRPS